MKLREQADARNARNAKNEDGWLRLHDLAKQWSLLKDQIDRLEAKKAEAPGKFQEELEVRNLFLRVLNPNGRIGKIRRRLLKARHKTEADDLQAELKETLANLQRLTVLSTELEPLANGNAAFNVGRLRFGKPSHAGRRRRWPSAIESSALCNAAHELLEDLKKHAEAEAKTNHDRELE